MEVVSKVVAKQDLDNWLDFHEINEDQKKELAPNINIIIAAIQSGHVIIDPSTNVLTQKLKHPFGKEKTYNELSFKSTGLPIGEVENNKSAISKDSDNRNTLAHLAVATGTAIEVLMKLSTKDFNTAAAIVIFFIV